MNPNISVEKWHIRDIIRSVGQHGPLGGVKRLCTFYHRRYGAIAPCRYLCTKTDQLLGYLQRHIDRPFDRQYGVDTYGFIPLKNLTIERDSTEFCIWYEPMSVKIFHQLMPRLNIPFEEFDFIDFGSGKGRALLLAGEYGFRKIVGVEFARELHRSACVNIRRYERFTGSRNRIENHRMDAVDFLIPDTPLVVFLYSPFKGEIMQKVLANITRSHSQNPRKIILLFYGRNPESIKLLQETGFVCREISLQADWSRFTRYRGLVFTSP